MVISNIKYVYNSISQVRLFLWKCLWNSAILKKLRIKFWINLRKMKLIIRRVFTYSSSQLPETIFILRFWHFTSLFNFRCLFIHFCNSFCFPQFLYFLDKFHKTVPMGNTQLKCKMHTTSFCLLLSHWNISKIWSITLLVYLPNIAKLRKLF